MPGPIIANPTPEWMKPENASVFDPMWKRLARKAGHLVGADDPQSQVVAMAAPMEVGPSGGLMGLAQKYLGKAIRAYHGSPHDFDKFDFSKIGSGEGAQAYGHGGYFAEAEGIARHYRDALATPTVEIMGQPQQVPSWSSDLSPQPRLIRRLADKRAKLPDLPDTAIVAKTRDDLRFDLDHVPSWDNGTRNALQNQLEILDAAEARGIRTTHGGKMYEVNIAADPKHLLDWDAPINAQSVPVQTELGTRLSARELGLTGSRAYGGVPTGADVYSRLGRGEVASRYLKDIGIPGIKYLDQVSRTQASDIPYLQEEIRQAQNAIKHAGSPLMLEFAQTTLANWEQLLAEAVAAEPTLTRNIVMFPGTENLISIARKYGLLPPLAASAAPRALDALRTGQSRDQLATPPPAPPSSR